MKTKKTIRLLLAAIAAMAVFVRAAPGISGEPEQLFKDPSFEATAKGGKDWFIWGGGGTAEVSFTTDQGPEGAAAVMLEGDPENESNRAFGVSQRNLPLKPNTTYEVAVDIRHEIPPGERAPSNRFVVRVQERGDGESISAEVIKEHTLPIRLDGKGEWTTGRAVFTTQEKPVSFYQLIFRANSPVKGEKIHLANASIVAIPSVSELWTEIKEIAKGYERRSGRLAVFSRAQLKYGLERDDYLHRWSDRPLYVDPELISPDEPAGVMIKKPVYEKMAKLVREYGMDGFAFFPETQRREELYGLATTPGREMGLLTEFLYRGSGYGDAQDAPDFTRKMELAKIALDSPMSYRIDGKVVITGYPRSHNYEYWGAIKAKLTETFGDKFILMPYADFSGGKRLPAPGRELTVDQIQEIRRHLRRWLRVVDGYYHNDPTIDDRRYAPEVDRDIITPILHSVLMEEEFKNKYLAWGTKVGHENYERLGYTFDSTGTVMLRGSVGSGIMAKADIINCIEWDEQNENTHFRPTVANARSTQRIIRAIIDAENKRPFAPVEGDDLDVPNLILSYRRILEAGRPLEFDLVNIPDDDRPDEYRVDLYLKNLSGAVVHRFPTITIAADKLNSAFPAAYTEDLLEHHVLMPEMIITGKGKTFTADYGFHPITLRASWNWDFKWVKHPLRDILAGAVSKLELVERLPDGAVELAGSISSPEELAHVEVVDGGDTIYMHQKDLNYRESRDHAAIEINWQSLSDYNFPLNGSIALKNSEGLWRQPRGHGDFTATIRDAEGNVERRRVSRGGMLDGQTLVLADAYASQRISSYHVLIPRAEADKAVFAIDIPGIFTGDLPAATILEREVMTYPGKNGFTLAFRRFASQVAIPPQLKEKTAEFRIYAIPAFPGAVFHLQAVTRSGKVYRSNPVSLYQPSGVAVKMPVFSEARNQMVVVNVDRNLATRFDYDFSPRLGAAIASTAGGAGYREFLAVASCHLPQVSGRGGGESLYGNILHNNKNSISLARRLGLLSAADSIRVQPERKRGEDGQWYFDFTPMNFITMPRALLPLYAGFVLETEVLMDDLAGSNVILYSNPTAPWLALENGVPALNSGRAGVIARGPGAVTPGQWAKIRVVNDQRTLRVSLDGVEGDPVEYAGCHQLSVPYGLGASAWGNNVNAFKGSIRGLKIWHYMP